MTKFSIWRCGSMMTLIGASSLVAPSLAFSAPLKPVGRWVVEFADTQCVASREYGDAKPPISLGIRQAPYGSSFEFLVVEDLAAPKLADQYKGSVDFGAGPISVWTLRYRATDRRTLYSYRISAAEMAQARGAKTVRLSNDKAGSRSFALADMAGLLDTLDKCTADLRQYWNEGGEADGRIAISAKGDVRHLFSESDFPSEAMKRDQEGSSRFVLLVDEKGKVAGCDILVSSGSPPFDVMGCQVLKARATFSPALDAKGKAMRSMVVTPNVVWRIEG